MPKTRKIDSDSYSIGEFLGKPFVYRVPSYQRDFAWKSEQIDMLWEDIAIALEDEPREYFLGAIVISQSNDDKRRDIVDGQQRLAALSMIFAAISKEWRKLKDEKRAGGVFRDYLGSEDRRTGEVIPKLTLNEINDPIFQALVLRGETFTTTERKMWPYSNRLLANAFSRINSKLVSWLKKFDDVESALLDLEEFVSDNTSLIVIEAGDDSDAFVIFETLNDRGLDLAPPDLIKNYLFSLAGPHIEKFKQAWSEIALLIGSENLTQFLRHFWLSEFALVRERDLYKALRKSIKTTTKARQLMERLRKAADFYAALMNPEHTYWADFPPEARNYLEALLLFNVAQFRPVALAVMEQEKPKNVTRALRMLMIISFRYTVISSLGTGNLEKTYTDAALAIRAGQTKAPRDIFKHLKSAYVDDERFINDFQQKKFTKSNVARYILGEINDHYEGDPERMVAERTGRITLEHILPKSPDEKWEGAVPKDEEASEYVDLIGNLTLLERGRNRGIANADFSEKRTKAFSQSNLFLNRELAKKPSWTHNDIVERSRQLAKAAKQMWRLDY